MMLDDDKLHEECGVFGVFLNDLHQDAAPLVYHGLFSLQHRGQEGAGIAVIHDNVIEPQPSLKGEGSPLEPQPSLKGEGSPIDIHKGMGLIGEVIGADALAKLKGHAAIGHVRYSTTGENNMENVQPFISRFKLGSIAVAHNGNLTNADVVRELLEDAGIGFTSSSDSEVIVNLIAKNYKKGLERAFTDTVKFIKGSYALIVLTDDALVGARDPNGIRPLCLGKIADGKNNGKHGDHSGWILSSESCAIEAVGGEFVRDIEPGELVIINREQVLSYSFCEKTRRAVCSFEYVYFARPDSVIDGNDVYSSRIRAGEILGREYGVPADLVIGVPDSGIPAAIGYGRATGTQFGVGIVKNKYIGRTFIYPEQFIREKAVSLKHFVIRSEVCGKRVVLIDDSIVRGTTSRRLVSLLKNAGAKEVHIRISSPPVCFPCYFGIDTPHRKDLISNASSADELCKFLGANSLAFISARGLLESIDENCNSDNPNGCGYCMGCFTGEYPIAVAGNVQ